MSYFRFMESGTDNPISDWVEALDMEIAFGGRQQENITGRRRDRMILDSPQRWGELGVLFHYSPASEITDLVHDGRQKDIVVSTTPDGTSFNTFQRVFIKTFSYGTVDYYSSNLTYIAEASWLFENALVTFQDIETIITNHTTQDDCDKISWEKYGF